MSRLLLAVLLLGCAPSPERVCGWRMRLSEERFGKSEPSARKKGLEHCIELAKKERAENPARYRCRAECALDSRHLDQVFECEKKC